MGHDIFRNRIYFRRTVAIHFYVGREVFNLCLYRFMLCCGDFSPSEMAEFAQHVQEVVKEELLLKSWLWFGRVNLCFGCYNGWGTSRGSEDSMCVERTVVPLFLLKQAYWMNERTLVPLSHFN